jgi:thiamine-monophosphate kinase
MASHNGKEELDLAALGEVELIERIRKKATLPAGEVGKEPQVLEGIGDDTAVVRWGTDKNLLLITCDTLVEEIHFAKGTPAYQIGWKAMGCSLSDIAAMGGRPCHAVVSLACPARMKVSETDSLYAGMMELAARYDVAVIGGDTVESPHGLVLTVTMTGITEGERYITRSGARAGDALCVTGELGGSLGGKHLTFVPRVDEGQFLAKTVGPTAMIDISDGLASDLTRLAEASHVGAEVLAKSIPISEAAVQSAEERGSSPLDAALYDGEDFELLFAVKAERVEKCLELFRRTFSTPVRVIGEVKPWKSGVTVIGEDGTAFALKAGGYEHFQKSVTEK